MRVPLCPVQTSCESISTSRTRTASEAVSRELPTKHEFLEAVNADDPLRLVLRTHQYLEVVLCELISAKLSAPHALDVERLTFPFKVDLAIALGTLTGESRAIWLKVNSVRNLFAHDSNVSWDEKLAQDTFNTLGPFHRRALRRTFSDYDSPIAALREMMAVLFIEATAMIEHLDDQKMRTEIFCEMAEDLLKDSPVREEGNPWAKKTDAEIDRRLQERKSSSHPKAEDEPLTTRRS